MEPYSTGHVLNGRYVLAGVLGEGGNGVVHRAVDLLTSHVVAVKLLRLKTTNREASIRLVREAQALAALAGTSVVHVLDMGTDRLGVKYLVMEQLHGHDLERHLRALEASGQRVPLAELIAVLDPVVDTLEAAHNLGIVHRDLKPANIFLLEPVGVGGVRLLDFGFVKMMGAQNLTAHGTVAGSAHYIAPEAWKGDPTSLDERIDVYALGVVAFRALAGRVPFPLASVPEILNAACRARRPSLFALRMDLPLLVDGWVERALAVDPEERFSSVRALWTGLRSMLR